MSKAQRKPRPSAPEWGYYAFDSCWTCPHKNGCSNCKMNKAINADIKKKRDRLTKQKLRQLTA